MLSFKGSQLLLPPRVGTAFDVTLNLLAPPTSHPGGTIKPSRFYLLTPWVPVSQKRSTIQSCTLSVHFFLEQVGFLFGGSFSDASVGAFPPGFFFCLFLVLTSYT